MIEQNDNLIAIKEQINEAKARQRALHLRELRFLLEIKNLILAQTELDSTINALEQKHAILKSAEEPSFFHRHFGR